MKQGLARFWRPAIKIILTLAFGAAGLAKLWGVDMMVATFDAIGVGQWFRYVTGIIEIASAIMLWIPGIQLLGAGLLVCTMIGAILAHLLILGADTMGPAVILGGLSALLAYGYRNQWPFAAYESQT